VSVPVQDVLTKVPEARLLAFLVLDALETRILDRLDVERGYLDYDFCDRKDG